MQITTTLRVYLTLVTIGTTTKNKQTNKQTKTINAGRNEQKEEPLFRKTTVEISMLAPQKYRFSIRPVIPSPLYAVNIIG